MTGSMISQDPSTLPTRMWVEVPLLDRFATRPIADNAVQIARSNMPKFTGALARDIGPLWGDGFFGIRWSDPAVWYQEIGIKAFTMTALAGKTIPMWIKDPTGEEQRKNPKADVRVGEDGVPRVLIFRRVAQQGQRKMVMRNGVPVSVPMSYPGAPGRISVREAPAPYTRPGKIGGRIAGGLNAPRTNVGVRWRHPGLTGRTFLFRGITQAAYNAGVNEPDMIVRVTNEQWR